MNNLVADEKDTVLKATVETITRRTYIYIYIYIYNEYLKLNTKMSIQVFFSKKKLSEEIRRSHTFSHEKNFQKNFINIL